MADDLHITPTLLEAALSYAARGWRVFPLQWLREGGRCTCGKKDCKSPGKHPRTPNGCLDGTTDADQIRRWWHQWPNANVGLATGHGLVALDVDPRHGGAETLVDLQRELGNLPQTVAVETGSGGRHIYLSPVDPKTGEVLEVRNSASVLGVGVDVRGDGGYVVAPPSVHQSGRPYRWEPRCEPENNPVARAPSEWLKALLSRPKLRSITGGGGKGEGITEGARNDSLYRLACSMRSNGMGRDAILAALLQDNADRCNPPLDPAEVKNLVDSACRHGPGLSPEYQAKRDEAEGRRAKRASREATAAPPEGDRTEANNPTADPADDWQGGLYLSPKGQTRNTFANLCTILRHAPEYQSLRHNEMTIAPWLDDKPLTDAALGLVREAVERGYGFSPGIDGLSQAILTVSSERPFHPVKEYLTALEWDGVPRIDHVCQKILAADPSRINVTLVRAWFTSAVARALKPGCKVDTALVLVGNQGFKKSTFFQVLGGEWFSDTAIDIENKDAYLQINGAWIYELSELDHVTSRSHAGRLKAFVSSKVDRFRAPFGRGVAAYPRTNVMVGSANEDQLLNDPSGSRRFWCVRVNREIPVALLEQQRDQLWAEAVANYRSGEAWWLSREAEAALDESSEEFRASDVWEDPVLGWVLDRRGDPAPITTRRILADLLRVPIADQDQRASNRIAAIMRKAGWRNKPERVNGKPERVWRRVVEGREAEPCDA